MELTTVQAFILSAIATFLYVFLRAFQQLNVVHKHYWRILPTSIGMGIGDILLVLLIIKTQSLWMGVTNGFAGASGCYMAIAMNHWLMKRENRP